MFRSWRIWQIWQKLNNKNLKNKNNNNKVILKIAYALHARDQSRIDFKYLILNWSVENDRIIDVIDVEKTNIS